MRGEGLLQEEEAAAKRAVPDASPALLRGNSKAGHQRGREAVEAVGGPVENGAEVLPHRNGDPDALTPARHLDRFHDPEDGIRLSHLAHGAVVSLEDELLPVVPEFFPNQAVDGEDP